MTERPSFFVTPNSSGFLRSSDQARLKISLVYFRILQWPYTLVIRLVDLKILVPLRAEQNTSQASGAAKVLHIFVFISLL